MFLPSVRPPHGGHSYLKQQYTLLLQLLALLAKCPYIAIENISYTTSVD
uniref:Uncharacterized protein n=1 Tax=Arundo donax TaxID=35708 RepID=A0A0A9BEU4_ARUDO